MPTTDTVVLDAQVEFIHRDFAKPLLLSSGAISKITEARVSVAVEMANGRSAVGRGSVHLSHLWAWRGGSLSSEERDTVLKEVCSRIAGCLPELCGEARHPLEHGLLLHKWARESPAAGAPPALARALCASPFDAAIHDAAGLALGRSAFRLYDDEIPLPLSDRCFPGTGACQAIRETLQTPLPALDAWLVVVRDDDLDDLIKSWASGGGYRRFKLKTQGADPAADARWTSEVYREAVKHGVADPRLSADSNEGNVTIQSVTRYLEELRRIDCDAYNAVEYLEQPTHRDIPLTQQDWRPVTRLKPVFLDEGLSDIDDFGKAKDAGWSGFAIKTCKGHSFCLIAATWARLHGMPVVMQDLTNPGFAAIHSALFASHIHPQNGIELNSPQYTPQANSEWLPRLQSLLEPRDGMHRLPAPIPDGLGSTL